MAKVIIPVFQPVRQKARRKEVLDWEYHFFIPFDRYGYFGFSPVGPKKGYSSWLIKHKINHIRNKLDEALGGNYYYAQNIFSFKTEQGAMLFRILW